MRLFELRRKNLLFLKKKKQKDFFPLRFVPARALADKSFLVLFSKKEHPSFLP